MINPSRLGTPGIDQCLYKQATDASTWCEFAPSKSYRFNELMIFFFLSIKHNACLINMKIEWLQGRTSIWHNLQRLKRQFMFGMDCNSQHTFTNSFLSTYWKHLICDNFNKGHMCVFLIVGQLNLKSITHQFKDMSGRNTGCTITFTSGHAILKKERKGYVGRPWICVSLVYG